MANYSRTLLTIVMVLSVVLAGCSGGGGGDGGDGAGSGDGPDGVDGADGGSGSDGSDGADGSDGSDGGSGGDGASDGGSGSLEGGEWEPFDFQQPGRWEYDVFIEEEGEGTMVLDITDVGNDQLTMDLLYEVGEERYESTFTGPTDSVQSQLYTNPAGVLLVTVMFTPGLWFGGQDIEVGTQWSYSTQEGSASFAVTGTDRVGGVDCYTTEMTVDGTTVYEFCTNPSLGLAPYSAWYNDDGTLNMKMTLTSYSGR